VTDAGAGRPLAEVPTDTRSRLSMLRAFRSDPLALLLGLHEKYGDLVRLRGTPFPLFLVSDPTVIQEALTMTGTVYAKGLPSRHDPDGPGLQPLSYLLGDGLLTSSGELHKRQRRLLQPLFHRERISEYAAAFAEIGAQDTWQDGERRDVHHDMVEMTLAVIARTVFDVDLDTDLAATIRRTVDGDLSPANGIGPGRIARRLRLPSVRRAERARTDLQAVVHTLIADRRRQGTGGRDVLSLLLDARDADSGAAMSDDQVTDEALTLLLAGHETTANALSWTLSLLARHPDAQARLHAELDDVVGDRPLTLADVPRLEWTTAVFNEAMRLYPPAWMMARRLREDRVICGYQLAAGSMLILSPYVVQRDPQWWPDPTSFNPERWIAGVAAELTEAARPRYAYFPFGGGSRQCIGNSFAQLEGVVLLAERCRRWSFTPSGPQPPASKPQVTLRPAAGVFLTVHARTLHNHSSAA
jgi:cytochrome P450